MTQVVALLSAPVWTAFLLADHGGKQSLDNPSAPGTSLGCVPMDPPLRSQTGLGMLGIFL